MLPTGETRPLPLHLQASRRTRYLNCDPCVVVASALLPVLMLGLGVAMNMARGGGSEL